MASKLAVIFIAIAVLFGYELTKINIPADFERPYLYRIFRIPGKFIKPRSANKELLNYFFIQKAKSAADYLNYGTEISNFRNILSVLSTVLPSPKSDNINIQYKTLENVPVRVYSPKSIKSNNLPAMIFYHGGGYVFGVLESYEPFLFDFVTKLNMVIISVDYRMGPEHPFPVPTTDCYTVTKYVLNHPKEFNADLSRLVFAGDSSGGNAVAVITQRLLEENVFVPKLQVLIYPWTQMFNNHLPSIIQYTRSGLLSTTFPIPKLAAFYLGINDASGDVENILMSNNHTALLTDKSLMQKIKGYLDINHVPEKYKSGRKYYRRYEIQKQIMYPEHLDRENILRQDKELASVLKKLYDPKVSPLFADSEKLVGLPKAYFVILEWDSLKDEGLLYAERLRQAGTHVHVEFYEDAFHGIIGFVNDKIGFQKARDIQRDLIKYLKTHL